MTNPINPYVAGNPVGGGVHQMCAYNVCHTLLNKRVR